MTATDQLIERLRQQWSRQTPPDAPPPATAHLLFFAGLLQEYPICAAAGKMDEWESCAHSIMNLIAHEGRALAEHVAAAPPTVNSGDEAK